MSTGSTSSVSPTISPPVRIRTGVVVTRNVVSTPGQTTVPSLTPTTLVGGSVVVVSGRGT